MPNSPFHARAQLRRLATSAAVVLASVCCFCGGVSADDDLGRVVSRMPIGVDFVAAVDDGASLRKDLHGSPVMLAAAALSRPAAVMNAWSEFAGELGMTDAEAFDLLLGQRVILVGSQLRADATEPPRWAILSELDPETERSLRSLLKAVPRRIVKGQPVLEFEHGSYLLATSNGRLVCGADGRFENTLASTILLLAPAADRELFDQMLPLLRCNNPERMLADVPAGRMVESWATRDAIVVWRIPDPLGSQHRFVGATFGTNGDGWAIDAMAYPADGWAKKDALVTIPTWSPALLGTLPSDAALAMIGSRESVREARAWIEPLVGNGLPDPGGDSFEHVLGRRSMLGVWIRPGEHGADSQTELLLAMDTPDLPRLAARADAYMKETIDARLGERGRQNARVASTPPQLSDVRSLSITGEDERAFEELPTLSWAFVPEAASGEDAGWWLMHSFPNGQSASADAEAAPGRSLQEIGRMPARRYLHVGRVRPPSWSAAFNLHAAETRRALSDEAGTALGVPALNEFVLGHIRATNWAVWLEDSADLLRAEFRLQLGDTAPIVE
ncbi:MAG: hypothetical protein ACF8LK_10355 [Phycisphaerales bacterium JB041]